MSSEVSESEKPNDSKKRKAEEASKDGAKEGVQTSDGYECIIFQ